MDVGIIIALLGSTIAIVGTVIALFLWTRSEANSERRDLAQIVRSLEAFTRDNITVIRDEMRDFHSRLIKIEESRK